MGATEHLLTHRSLGRGGRFGRALSWRCNGGALRPSALLLLVTLLPGASIALNLPGQRSEAMYHYYDGGGVTVDGPALLGRVDAFGDFQFSAAWYRDSISGASPDVIATASPYTEERNELGVGMDYLYSNSLVNLRIAASEEPDYEARSYGIGIEHEVFGGMTLFRLGYQRGHDIVTRVDDAEFMDTVDTQAYTLGLSQVLTSTLVMNVNYEAILDEGFLNNPYRSKRVLGVFAGPEIYPRTRSSSALAVRTMKAWSPSSSSMFGYRYFWDTWDIQAHTLEASYTKGIKNGWLVDLYYRYYTQTAASFYSDNFLEEQTYMARDKELATYDTNTLGARFSWPVFSRKGGLNQGVLQLSYEVLDTAFEDYSDATTDSDEPWSFTASSAYLYFSVWY